MLNNQPIFWQQKQKSVHNCLKINGSDNFDDICEENKSQRFLNEFEGKDFKVMYHCSR